MDLGFFMPDLTGDGDDVNGAQPSSQQPSLEEIASAARAAAGLASSGMAPSLDTPLIPALPLYQQAIQPNSVPDKQQQPSGSKATTTTNGGNGGGPAKPIGMACRACRLRKIRCGGERPRCTYCVKKGYECVLTPHKKRGRPRKNSQRGGNKPREADADDDVPLAAGGAGAKGGNSGEESPGMRAMRMPVDEDEEEGEEPSLGDTMLDGLDIDVHQLWAELTGLQGLDLPPELSALAANSAIQPIDAYPTSIPSLGPSFNLAIAQQQQQQQPLSVFAQPQASSLGAISLAQQQQQKQPTASIPPPLPLHSSAAAGGVYAGASLAGDGNMNMLSAANLGDMNMFASNYAFPRQTDGPRSASPLTTPRPPPADKPGRPIGTGTTGAEAKLGIAAEDARSGSSVDGHTATSATSADRRKQSVRERSASSTALDSTMPPIRQTVDEGVRLYFVYVHPWLPILHRPTFERQITEGRVDPILYYAVQAVAARFKDRDTAAALSTAARSAGSRSNQQSQPSVRKPYKRGQRYARAARALLPESLRDARLSTLQAITIMALYMSVSGHWQEGAAYERLAVQLAFIGQYHLLDEEFLLPPVTNNMGLYESGWSEHSHPARLEVLSRPGGVLEHEQRRRAWWSIFQLERFNGLAMGRPPIIKPGWHWVWLPCSEDLWARDNPSGALAWEMGLADFSQRPATSVSNCRVDLILALVMGQIIDQRTELFRLFFPRVDRGTLFYDNLPTHSLTWPVRLRKLCEAVTVLERRIRQWHAELDRYADSFSARRHANFELMGASCQIHLFACVLQIREHLFEDLLVGEEARAAMTSAASASAAASSAEAAAECNDTDDDTNMSDRASSRNSSSVDMAAVFERQTGVPFDRSAYQRGYVAKAKRPEMTLQFVHDLDTLAQRCWDRSVAMSDEIARLLRVHWLRPFDNKSATAAASNDDDGGADLASFISPNIPAVSADDSKLNQPSSAAAAARRPSIGSSTSASSAPAMSMMDPQIADRFKLMNPQTPYHLFVAGKVQAARLKQAVTAQQAAHRKKTNALSSSGGGPSSSSTMMDVDDSAATAPDTDESTDYSPEVVADAVRRINDIWDAHGLAADAKAVTARLDDIITALEYSQLFWNSLNFASHLRYLKREAAKPLLSDVFRE
ncbi:hypothetical protein EV175_000840 [Coemansia sp. RSA 1933]|nr:hypothetical protein EV175_000840 [Coemansia sp. RSA 1933]